mmetsp:Transcript_36649/g.114791  ORF Transcript_36649/g.114791 Transcript_36649/m.114791 type:complete len:208 (+) Transcript_36649:80-703(+)
MERVRVRRGRRGTPKAKRSLLHALVDEINIEGRLWRGSPRAGLLAKRHASSSGGRFRYGVLGNAAVALLRRGCGGASRGAQTLNYGTRSYGSRRHPGEPRPRSTHLKVSRNAGAGPCIAHSTQPQVRETHSAPRSKLALERSAVEEVCLLLGLTQPPDDDVQVCPLFSDASCQVCETSFSAAAGTPGIQHLRAARGGGKWDPRRSRA